MNFLECRCSRLGSEELCSILYFLPGFWLNLYRCRVDITRHTYTTQELFIHSYFSSLQVSYHLPFTARGQEANIVLESIHIRSPDILTESRSWHESTSSPIHWKSQKVPVSRVHCPQRSFDVSALCTNIGLSFTASHMPAERLPK